MTHSAEKRSNKKSRGIGIWTKLEKGEKGLVDNIGGPS